MKPETFTIEGLPYLLTRDPQPADRAMDRLMERLHHSLGEGRPDIRELEDAVRRYPGAPEFKNYLTAGLKIKGRKKEAERVILQTIEAHPGYLIGRIDMADMALDREQPEEALRWLGETLRLEDLYPERDVFHVSEVMNYVSVCVRYLLAVDDVERAFEWRRRLKAIDPEHPIYVQVCNRIGIHRMRQAKERMDAEQKLRRTVTSYPKVRYEPATRPPDLTHPEVRLLYQHPKDDFPQGHITTLAALPRAGFVADLERVLLDAARRFDYFSETYKEWNAAAQSFPVHALYWLGALEAEEALPTVLNLLRQGGEVLDYWFGDGRGSDLWRPLYLIGRRRLPDLRDFATEGNLDAWVRAAACQAVAQIAHHDPARRGEVIDWFRQVLRHHLDHPGDETLIDTTFLGQAAWALLDLRAHELEAEMAQLYANQWVMPSLLGTWEQVQPRLREPLDESDREPLPESIGEFYDGSYLERRVVRGEATEEDRRKLLDAMEDPFLETLTRLFENALGPKQKDEDDDEEAYRAPPPKPQTVVKTGPKIGRNDPCPCGSGRKYKHCHGKG